MRRVFFAVAAVFNAAPSVLETPLSDYVHQNAMRFQIVDLDQRVMTRVEGEPVRVSEVEAQARLGDLLAHTGRTDEATAQLTNVLKTAPELPLAHAALGALLLRQDKDNEAMPHLERAAAAPKAAGEALLLRAARFDAVDFISYRSTTPGRISCGPRRPAEDVYVTWRRDETSGTSAGTAVAVELLPDGYVPTK